MDIHLRIAVRLHAFIELVEKLDVDDYATAMKMGLAHANSDCVGTLRSENITTKTEASAQTNDVVCIY